LLVYPSTSNNKHETLIATGNQSLAKFAGTVFAMKILPAYGSQTLPERHSGPFRLHYTTE